MDAGYQITIFNCFHRTNQKKKRGSPPPAPSQDERMITSPHHLLVPLPENERRVHGILAEAHEAFVFHFFYEDHDAVKGMYVTL